jgi:hypothetical protein
MSRFDRYGTFWNYVVVWTFIKRVFNSKQVVIAAVALLVTALGWNITLDALGYVLAKKSVPLNRPLEETPEALGRFVLAKDVFKDYPDGKVRLTKDIEEILGTEKYITWIYRDTESPANAPVFIRLHVAYYTDILDAAPHVPDICQLAGGAQAAGSNTVLWTVPTLAAPWREVSLRRSAFVSKDSTSVVFYVFNVNGKPIDDRQEVRLSLSPPWKKYCYYAKIELAAFGGARALTPEENDEICAAFFASAAPEILGLVASAEEIKAMEAAD